MFTVKARLSGFFFKVTILLKHGAIRLTFNSLSLTSLFLQKTRINLNFEDQKLVFSSLSTLTFVSIKTLLVFFWLSWLSLFFKQISNLCCFPYSLGHLHVNPENVSQEHKPLSINNITIKIKTYQSIEIILVAIIWHLKYKIQCPSVLYGWHHDIDF